MFILFWILFEAFVVVVVVVVVAVAVVVVLFNFHHATRLAETKMVLLRYREKGSGKEGNDKKD